MPAYCVAANCNNSQTTPGITMHELPRNWPAVRRKWIKSIQFKRGSDFLDAPHHAHLCSEHFTEWVWFRKTHGILILFPWKSCLAGSNWYGCILVGLSGKVSVRLRSSSWPFCSDSPEWRSSVTWFGRRGDAFRTTDKYLSSCIYNRPQPDHSFTYIIVLIELERKSYQKSPLTLDLSFNSTNIVIYELVLPVSVPSQYQWHNQSEWPTRLIGRD